MTKKFKKLDDLFRYAEKQIRSTLRDDVAKTAVKTMSDVVVQETYAQYEPTEYKRRGIYGGGLADPREYTVEIVNDNTISITNDATGNDFYDHTEGWDSGPIDGIIVYGVGYNWKRSKIYKLQPFPRDFYGGTVRRLEDNKDHIKAMKKGLRERGIKAI